MVSDQRFFPKIFWNLIYLREYPLRKHIEKAIKDFQIHSHEKWLDVGYGLRPYEDPFPQGCYTGVDVESSGRNYTMKTIIQKKVEY